MQAPARFLDINVATDFIMAILTSYCTKFYFH